MGFRKHLTPDSTNLGSQLSNQTVLSYINKLCLGALPLKPAVDELKLCFRTDWVFAFEMRPEIEKIFPKIFVKINFVCRELFLVTFLIGFSLNVLVVNWTTQKYRHDVHRDCFKILSIYLFYFLRQRFYLQTLSLACKMHTIAGYRGIMQSIARSNWNWIVKNRPLP